MNSSMRSSRAAAGRGERRGSFFFVVRRRNGRGIRPTVANRAMGADFDARSGAAQPGVDGCGAGFRVQASDGDLQVRPLIGPLEIGDVRLDLLQAEDPLPP